MEQQSIRNFCIIAHIDHGKSTLADRFLELTGVIGRERRVEQFLDQMDLERERGITIKAKALRMSYLARDGRQYAMNLIDTPGHVDFTYEVSRALAACEGAILVVDATQGIQAQTLAHAFLALDHGLVLIPVINKIDLAQAEPERVAQELEETFGFHNSDILLASAKEGVGVEEILEEVGRRIPSPKGKPEQPLRALIFDSKYDVYKGVIAYVRVVDGGITFGQRIRLMATGKVVEAMELGVFTPSLTPTSALSAGEVGYIATGLKNVQECRVGDTITLSDKSAQEPLLGYRPLTPMVFAGLYPVEPRDHPELRDALEKLKLNDAGLSFETEVSIALGAGFRCGFLGLLHMEIVQERLEREFGLDLLATAPSVAYLVVNKEGQEEMVENPAFLPPPERIEETREPWLNLTVLVPSRYLGTVMDLLNNRRGHYRKMEYLEAGIGPTGPNGSDSPKDPRVLLEYGLPLSEMLMDFYDQLKSRTQGYATMDYILSGYLPGPMVKLDILVNQQPVDALSTIVHRDKSYQHGRALVEKLKETIPRQLFDVPIQAAIGSRVIARETIRAKRKDVLAKCYGGDITRKMKLLEKQKEGKKRMKMIGRVEIPQEAFLALLKVQT